mmetsp:Transcript_18217/g.42412  ORF Transcript_18217/g.42412 Transcript_18217/m.42412 type:complete len:342 (-) Transcript_18217:86-1111(-)
MSLASKPSSLTNEFGKPALNATSPSEPRLLPPKPNVSMLVWGSSAAMALMSASVRSQQSSFSSVSIVGASSIAATASVAPPKLLYDRSRLVILDFLAALARAIRPFSCIPHSAIFKVVTFDFIAKSGINVVTHSSPNCGLYEKSSSVISDSASITTATSSARPRSVKFGFRGTSKTASSAFLRYFRMASASCNALSSLTHCCKSMTGRGPSLSLKRAITALTEIAEYASGRKPQRANLAGKDPSQANLHINIIHATTVPSITKMMATRPFATAANSNSKSSTSSRRVPSSCALPRVRASLAAARHCSLLPDTHASGCSSVSANAKHRAHAVVRTDNTTFIP